MSPDHLNLIKTTSAILAMIAAGGLLVFAVAVSLAALDMLDGR